MKAVNVIHYFVLGQIITKDGRLTNRYSCYDNLSKQKAEAKLAEMQGKKGYTRFEIIEYVARQKPIKVLIGGKLVEDFNHIYVVPKNVKDEYQRRIKSQHTKESK